MPDGQEANPQHVFEGTPVNVVVSIVTGVATVDSAKFTFRRVNADQSVADLPVVDGPRTKKEYKARLVTPEVGAGGDSYRLNVKVTVGDRTFMLGKEWIVWRERVTLQTKRKIEGALTKIGDFNLRIAQAGQSRDHRIPFEGEYAFLLTQPGPFDIHLEAPARFVNYLEGKDKGPIRILEWEVAPAKATITSPAPGAEDAAVKRYVNVRGEGNEIDLIIETRNLGGSAAVAMQKVFVECNFTNDTQRGKGANPAGDPNYATERTIVGLSNVVKSNGNLTWKGDCTSVADGTARLKLYLGKGGGEKAEVKVGCTNTCEDGKILFESWRKLYIQYSHSGTDLTRSLWSDDKRKQTTDCFTELFIDLEYLADFQIPKPIPPDWMGYPDDRSGWVDGTEVELGTGEILLFNVGGETWSKVAKKSIPDPRYEGNFINVMAADKSIEYQPFASTQTIKKDFIVGERAKYVAQFQGADCPIISSNGKAQAPNDENMFFGPLPKKDLFKSRASYILHDVKTPAIRVDEGVIPPERIEIKSDKALRGKVTIYLPASILTKLEADAKLRCKVDYSVLMQSSSGFAGLSNGKQAVLLVPGSDLKELNNTICHEIGHAINMVCDVDNLRPSGGDAANFVNRVPDFTVVRHAKAADDTLSEHPWWYVKRGHQGGHCALGTSKKTYDDWGNLDKWHLNINTFTCVIYGSAQLATTPVKFCEHCAKIIRAMEVWTGKKPRA